MPVDNQETATEDSKIDINDDESSTLPEETTKVLAVIEAAALLTMWSLLVINEGSVRVIRSVPSDLGRTVPLHHLSPYLVFSSGLVEMFFGLLGLFVGVSAFVFQYYSTVATKVAMAVQHLMSYYVFFVFVFVEPVVRTSNLEAPTLAGTTLDSSRLLITLSIFTALHFHIALQAGQFIFMARLVAAHTGADFLWQRSGNQLRAFLWTGNMALAGLWTLLTGIVLQVELERLVLDETFQFSVNVGRIPLLTAVTGFFMLFWGAVGAVISYRKSGYVFYTLGIAITYPLALVNFGIGQFGLIADSSSGKLSLHTPTQLLPLFLTKQS